MDLRPCTVPFLESLIQERSRNILVLQAEQKEIQAELDRRALEEKTQHAAARFRKMSDTEKQAFLAAIGVEVQVIGVDPAVAEISSFLPTSKPS